MFRSTKIFSSSSLLFFLSSTPLRLCSQQQQQSSTSSSSLLHSELTKIFSATHTLAISQIATSLSDDALDELGETSLKDWIQTNMAARVKITKRDDGKFLATWGNANSSGTIPPPPPRAPHVPMTKSEKRRDFQLRKEQELEEVRRVAKQHGGKDLDPWEMEALSQTRPVTSAAQQPSLQQQTQQAASTTTTIQLDSVPAPDLWEQLATEKTAAAAASSVVSAAQVAASSTQHQQQEAVARQRAKAAAARSREMLSMRMTFCCPNFVVPLCDDTLRVLESMMANEGTAVKEFLESKVWRNDVAASASVLDRLRFLMGEEVPTISSSSSLQLPFPPLDKTAIELVKIESFAPTPDLVSKWCSEDPDAPRVDALVPARISGLELRRHNNKNSNNPEELQQEQADADAAQQQQQQMIEEDVVQRHQEEVARTQQQQQQNGVNNGEDQEVSAQPSSSATSMEATAHTRAPQDFQPPGWIQEVVDNDGVKYRYFFRLSPPFHQEKGEARAAELDAAYAEFQAQEYDAFRLARCLPPNSVSISLKKLVVGGVLNVLSQPDLQHIVTAFPEMFEFPIWFDNSSNDNNNAHQQRKPEEAAVRFVLASIYDKPALRTPDVIRAELNDLMEIRRTRVDPATGKKMSGGQYMRLFNKVTLRKKELAHALQPGHHPLKDPRILAQLLFDLLPSNDAVDLSILHHKLKNTEVQLGEQLSLAFFRRYPHLFTVVETGTSERHAVLRADIEVPAIYRPKPVSEDQMLHDVFQVYRRLVKGRTSVASSLIVAKVQTSSRLTLESMFSHVKKYSAIGRAMAEHYSDCFQVASLDDASGECWITLNSNAERVRRLVGISP